MRHAGRRKLDGESSEEMLIGDLVGPLPLPTPKPPIHQTIAPYQAKP